MNMGWTNKATSKAVNKINSEYIFTDNLVFVRDWEQLAEIASECGIECELVNFDEIFDYFEREFNWGLGGAMQTLSENLIINEAGKIVQSVDAPDWIWKLILKVDQGDLNVAYRFISRVADRLTENDPDDWQDLVFEVAPDIALWELSEWALQHGEYVNTRLAEGFTDTYVELLQAAQRDHQQEVGGQVINFIEKLFED